MMHGPRSRSSYVLVGVTTLAACFGGERARTGECPPDEVCSPRTPFGLYFYGARFADEWLTLDVHATAIGGTQEITLSYNPPNSNQIIDLDLPYRAETDGTPVEVERTDGPVVTLRGTAYGKDYLRIVDPDTGELYDRDYFWGAEIQEIELIGTTQERLPPGNPAVVWTPGHQSITIALHGQGQRLVDTSMQIDAPGGYQSEWDAVEIPNAQVGVYPVTVTAGDKPPTTLEIEIVAGPTEIRSISGDTPTVPAGGGTTLCFAAMHDARFVRGLRWQFRIDGAAAMASTLIPNCVDVLDRGQSSTITVEASAGGLTKTVIAHVGQGARTTDDTAPLALEGERGSAGMGERARLAHGH
jgi:hypothetical protein